jgi:hypothetical protein
MFALSPFLRAIPIHYTRIRLPVKVSGLARWRSFTHRARRQEDACEPEQSGSESSTATSVGMAVSSHHAVLSEPVRAGIMEHR